MQHFTGIIILYPQGSVEILDDSDDIENRVKLWKKEVKSNWLDQLNTSASASASASASSLHVSVYT